MRTCTIIIWQLFKIDFICWSSSQVEVELFLIFEIKCMGVKGAYLGALWEAGFSKVKSFACDQ